MKISACCIIKNEEENLPAYIDGVKDIADEIIIADTGSTDNSIKILEELKEKYNLNLTVCYFEWINDFAAAKNFVLEKVTGDWVLFLDADEYFDKKDRKKIRPFLESILDDKKVMGVSTPLLNVDKYNNNAPLSRLSQIRIFRKQDDLIFTGAVHEHLWYQGTSTIVYINMNFLIIHTGYSPALSRKKNKRNNEIILANKDLAQDDWPSYYGYLAVAYAEDGKLKEAEENIKRVVELSKKPPYDNFLTVFYKCYFTIKQRQNASRKEIEKIMDESIEATAEYPDMLAEKLIFIMEENNLDLIQAQKLAEKIIEKAKDISLRKKYVNSIDMHLPYVHYVLGAIYKTQNKNKEAQNEFLTALKSYRYREDILTEFLSLSEDNEKKAAKILNEYYNEKNESDKEFLSKIFENLPRNGLYKKFANADKNSIDYKLASGKITDAVKLAGKEVETAKTANLPPEEFKKNLKEKLYLLAVSFLFLNINEITKVENELNLLPPSVIAVILRFYGEELPNVEGEIASYNAIMPKAKIYLPKELRERFLGLNI